MRVTMSFKLPEDHDEYELAMKGSAASAAIEDIAWNVFRPYRKHGYEDPELRALFEANPVIYDFMSILETKFRAILVDHGVG